VSAFRIALVSGGLALAGASLAAHAQSVSYAQFTIDDQTVSAIVRLPMDDVDLLLRLDRDLDGRVSAEELVTARGVLAAYIARHLHVTADGVELPPILQRATTWRDGSRFEYLETAVAASGGRQLRVVSIRSDFLTELYPAHTTQGRIAAAGREERFVFHAGANYECRVADDRWTVPALLLGAAAILTLLWFARGRAVALTAAFLVIAGAARADIIMSAAGLNATLKRMERLTAQAASGAGAARAQAVFRIGMEADGLASLINDEIVSHGTQERDLIDLALQRTKEIGISIAYNRDKKKFFYDGAAFRQYLSAAPNGDHAAEAEFTLISYQFYQSDGSDVRALVAGADAKKTFLARYPKFKGNAELSLYLAIDYRDAYRHYRGAHDTANAEKYRQLTRAEYQRIARQYAGTEQADSARGLLQRFDEETQK
jgi:hypothetical protein